MLIITLVGFFIMFIPDNIYLKVITLIITAGIVFSFIPNNVYLKGIILLTTIIAVISVVLCKVKNENTKLKKNHYNKLDSTLLKEIKKMFNNSYCFHYMRNYSFEGTFRDSLFEPLNTYDYKLENDSEFYFLDPDLNALKKDLDYNIKQLIYILNENTFFLDVNPELISVPKFWREDQPERFNKATIEADHRAKEIVKVYDELIQLARKKTIQF